MQYVIDGYNLLHALGLFRARAGPAALLKARVRLLQFLRENLGEQSSSATVVFDAQDVPAGLPEEEYYEGIHVRYAVHEPHADDLIEEIIRRQSVPSQLAVVSDDHRLQRAAERRHCKALGCSEFFDLLEQRRKQLPRPAGEDAGKPSGVSQDELRDWLRHFGDLQNDPNLKALSEPREWEDIDG
ncbi:MAG TPA: NYN domain-containing protein [Gemmataceae bacterium]|jgi:predicted RNA-binding protein with PIN domain|nr:NYN domain-containing protein [Gemmataceae bacterium]